MPELIEVELYRGAAETVVGDTLIDVPVLDPRYRRELPAAAIRDAVGGATIEQVRRIGKLLLLDTDHAVVGLRFGMTGRLLVDGRGPIDRLEYGASRDDRRWDRLVMRLATGRNLTINDPRRFGRIELDPDESALGPDAASISVADIRAALDGSHMALKARLLDQRRVSGLGNLLVDEVLWRSGLDPRRPASSLLAEESRALAHTVRRTIRTLTERGGSHTGDLQPARASGGTCPVDGSELRVDRVGGRATYWCAAHQR